MKKLNSGAVLALAFAVAGCAAIFDGTTQQISVNTNPAGAQCKFWRNGASIADIAATPSAVTIQKTKHDLQIVCSKPGYVDSTYMNKSGVAGATFANILGGVVTGGIAWAVDSGSGADNKYESQVNMFLAPIGGAVPAETARPTVVTAPAPTAPAAAAGVTPAAEATPAAPAGTELECVHSSGSRSVFPAGACPSGWTPAR